MFVFGGLDSVERYSELIEMVPVLYLYSILRRAFFLWVWMVIWTVFQISDLQINTTQRLCLCSMYSAAHCISQCDMVNCLKTMCSKSLNLIFPANNHNSYIQFMFILCVLTIKNLMVKLNILLAPTHL